MKRKIILFMLVSCLLQNTFVVSANSDTSLTEETDSIDGVINGVAITSENADELESTSEEISVITMAEGSENEELQQYGSTEYDDSSVDVIGDASIKTEVTVNDNALPLYPTFDNREQSLENIKQSCFNLLSLLSETYALDELSDTNYMNYYDCMYGYLDNADKVDWYNETNEEFVMLTEFFDIYENDDVNAALCELALEADSGVDLMEEDEFLLNLPCTVIEDVEDSGIEVGLLNKDNDSGIKYSSTSLSDNKPNLNNLVNNNYVSNAMRLAYSSSKGISYASSHAESRSNSFPKFDSDCTNFASQILYYAGKGMNDDWHCSRISSQWDYTVPWVRARSFASYWGVDYRYTDFYAMSVKVKAGDFISYDSTSDGSFDHIGYVTALGSANSVNTYGYKDFRVAQHTSDYHRWVSDSKNGWDTLKSSHPSITFGIIRIG